MGRSQSPSDGAALDVKEKYEDFHINDRDVSQDEGRLEAAAAAYVYDTLPSLLQPSTRGFFILRRGIGMAILSNSTPLRNPSSGSRLTLPSCPGLA